MTTVLYLYHEFYTSGPIENATPLLDLTSRRGVKGQGRGICPLQIVIMYSRILLPTSLAQIYFC